MHYAVSRTRDVKKFGLFTLSTAATKVAVHAHHTGQQPCTTIQSFWAVVSARQARSLTCPRRGGALLPCPSSHAAHRSWAAVVTSPDAEL